MVPQTNLTAAAQRAVSALVERAKTSSNVSTSDLAARTGMSRKTLTRRLATGEFTFAELAVIAAALDADLGEWFRELADLIATEDTSSRWSAA